MRQRGGWRGERSVLTLGLRVFGGGSIWRRDFGVLPWRPQVVGMVQDVHQSVAVNRRGVEGQEVDGLLGGEGACRVWP